MDKIPCTVALLTKNNESTLPRALMALKEFAEIIICDGGSTDETLPIASQMNVKLLKQDPAYLGSDGRITNFAGVRNQTLKNATQPWFFFLDSDEYIDEVFVNELRSICSQKKVGAYWVPRRYVYNGNVVECSAAYPNKSMRLFARASVTEFVKTIHERILLKEGTTPEYMNAHLFVPVIPTVRSERSKGDRYIALQIAQAGDFGFRQLMYVTYRTGLSSLAYCVRMVRARCFCRGERMPIYFEYEDLFYNVRLIARFWSSFVSRRVHS